MQIHTGTRPHLSACGDPSSSRGVCRGWRSAFGTGGEWERIVAARHGLVD